MADPARSATGSDWTVQAADTIESVVVAVRSKTTDPLVGISTARLDVFPPQFHSRHEALPGGGWAALAAAVVVAALVTGRRSRRTTPGSSPAP